MTSPLVLASASPRRRELLGALGLRFRCEPADIDEDAVARGHAPVEGAAAVACAKALTVRARIAEATILAADTIVVVAGQMFGKPVDREDARRMLEALRGRAHEVATAVHVASRNGVERAQVVTTSVRMRSWSATEVKGYLDSGAPLDKAGAYGIQDQPFDPVAAIDGCRCNVIGLPLWVAVELLRTVGVTVPRRPDQVIAGCGDCPFTCPGGANAPGV